MTREEARRKAEVMNAYAEGKEIEVFDENINDWDKIDNPSFNWGINVYRLKPEPTYRPFKDKEECWAEMQKHQPFGWIKHKIDGYFSCPTFICDETDFISFYEILTFADGTPFGIKV